MGVDYGATLFFGFMTSTDDLNIGEGKDIYEYFEENLSGSDLEYDIHDGYSDSPPVSISAWSNNAYFGWGPKKVSFPPEDPKWREELKEMAKKLKLNISDEDIGWHLAATVT